MLVVDVVGVDAVAGDDAHDVANFGDDTSVVPLVLLLPLLMLLLLVLLPPLPTMIIMVIMMMIF